MINYFKITAYERHKNKFQTEKQRGREYKNDNSKRKHVDITLNFNQFEIEDSDNHTKHDLSVYFFDVNIIYGLQIALNFKLVHTGKWIQ